MNRKEFLKRLGLLTVTASLGPLDVRAMVRNAEPQVAEDDVINISPRGLESNVSKPVTVIVIGAGSRGNTYARYSKLFPQSMKIVGVSDINPERRAAFARKYSIGETMCFGDWSEVFLRDKMSDVVVISTPDDLHYGPCMKALSMGYDVLLEKPAAQTEKECKAILAQSKKYDRIVGVCHVLRYAPYFIALKQTLDSGCIGDIVSIQHMEPIQYAHMAHSYVRGNWRNSQQTTPIILAKSCHDLDIIRWLIGKPCQTITADGSLHLFKEEMAPQGAPMRCTDGCPHEATCPYSAIDIYVRKKRHLHVFDLPDRKNEDAIMEKLRTTGYGRCVYHCDNDQPDHYVTNMTFEGGATASFTMDAFTPFGGRRTRIMGTKGYIEGDMKQFTVYDFRTGKKAVWDKKVQEVADYKNSGHGGGDMALVRDFLESVSAHDYAKLSSNMDASVESHVMGFKAEQSRKSMKKIIVK